MATKYSVVDVDKDDESPDQLDFHDIPHSVSMDEEIDTSVMSSGKKVQTHTFTKFPQPEESEDDDGDKADLLTGEKKTASFWKFEYYQNFFDVDTFQVLRRVLGSVVPNPRTNFLEHHIRPNPDMYGPFWICTTLVFTTAIAGNMANYFQHAGYIHQTSNSNFTWHYDFHKVTFAATAVFSYWWVIPTLLWALLWWRGSKAGYTYLEIICVYGYSIAIYIPISILFVIPFNWLQWILVLVGMLLSGTVLLFTFWPAVRDDDRKIAFVVMGFIMIFHGLLATGFVLYFFHVPSTSMAPDVPVSTALPHIPGGNGPTHAGVVQKVPTTFNVTGASRLLEKPKSGPLQGQQVSPQNMNPQQVGLLNTNPPPAGKQNAASQIGGVIPPGTPQSSKEPTSLKPVASQLQNKDITSNNTPIPNQQGGPNPVSQNPNNIPPVPKDNSSQSNGPHAVKRMINTKQTDILKDSKSNLGKAQNDMTAAAS